MMNHDDYLNTSNMKTKRMRRMNTNIAIYERMKHRRHVGWSIAIYYNEERMKRKNDPYPSSTQSIRRVPLEYNNSDVKIIELIGLTFLF